MEEEAQESRIIKIDRDRCIGCGECLDVCPQTTRTDFPVYVRGEDGVPEVANPESCIGCLSCQVSCRAEAVTVSGAMPPAPPIGGRAARKAASLF